MQAPRWLGNRWLRVAGLVAHWGAVFWAFLAAEIALFGGIRVNVAMRFFSARHVVNPLVFAVLCFALGWLLRPDLGLWGSPLGRLAKALRGLVRRPFAARRLAILAALVAVVATSATFKLVRLRHLTMARQFVTLGRTDIAAQHYLDAIMPLDPMANDLRQSAAYASWRAGKFDDCVTMLEPIFQAGHYMAKRGYKALWNCYRAQDRVDEAIEVAKVGMAVHPQLERQAAGALASFERERVPSAKGKARVTFFVPRSAAPEAAALHLGGSWNRFGEPSEVTSYEPVSLSPGADGFSATVELAANGDFPYTVAASTTADFSTPAVAVGQFRLDPGQEQEKRVELVAQPALGWLPPVAQRKPTADGHRRVLVVWPDGGSWFLLNGYAKRGLMPNIAQLLRTGARGEMISTNPPFTATAYKRMVELEPANYDPEEGGLLEVLALQLKGIPFLDGFLPDSLVSGSEGRTIYDALSANGLIAANLVFSDRFVSSPDDLKTSDGRRLEIGEDALATARGEGAEAIDASEAAAVLTNVLHIDAAKEPERAAALTSLGIFLYGVDNSEAKVKAGLDVWQKNNIDFMLLRLPSVDILSHRYFWTVDESFVQNPMIETYRYFDAVVGRFIETLDADDTLVVVSDHGVAGTLHHHRACLLIVDGPGIQPGTTLPTLPIGGFPVVILSRFGIGEGKDRLEDDVRATLTAGVPPRTAPTVSQ